MKRKKRDIGDSQAWLNTYADMITLVLTFFVLLYSISNVNVNKLKEVAAAMQKKLGIETELELEEVDPNLQYPKIQESDEQAKVPTPAEEALQKATQDIQEYINDNSVGAAAVQQDNVVYIRFKNDMLFGPDSADILPEAMDFLSFVGDELKQEEGEIMAVYVNGHTAGGTNSPVNDRILSSDRANNVAIYFEEQKGIDPRKLISRGYGKNYPIADNSTAEGREQNRRVDIIVLGKDFTMDNIDNSSGEEIFDPLNPIEVPDALNPDGQ